MLRFIMKQQALVLLALMTVFLPLNLQAESGPNLSIVTGLAAPLLSEDEKDGFLYAVLSEAVQRINGTVNISRLPAERVLVSANNGLDDGVLLRIKGLEKFYPNLRRVPEKMMNSEFVGYSINKNIEGGDFNKLKQYSVAYVNGWKIFEKNLASHPYAQKVTTPLQLFRLLQIGRTETILYEKWQGLAIARNLQIKNLYQLKPAFITLEMFMYLHKKNESVIPALALALKGLKTDGTYQKLEQEYLYSLEN